MFSEKLDFMMRLTGTRASTLGAVCHLNPSHVSRLRNGSRALPKNPEFLMDMSLYFARHITDDYQKRALCDALKLRSWPGDVEAGAAQLSKWFREQTEAAADITPILTSFSGPQPAAHSGDSGGALPQARSYYYGPTGKQEAVLQFFDLILKEPKPQTLYLASDEEMGWLYEDPAFSAQWLRRFTQVVQAGNRIKIVHSIGRNMNEMLEAVAKWLPVYTTGAVEPYFYPKLRDGILQRTLFLAPRTAAVTSVSVGQRSEGRLNELITDKEALKALAGEYQDFLALCRPLMQIITLPNRNDLWLARNTLLSAPGDTICMSACPTLATMPPSVAQSLQERLPGSDIQKQWRAAGNFIRKLRAGGNYVEILPQNLPDDPPELPCADLLGTPGARYTHQEWKAHVDHTARFSSRHPGYRAVYLPGIPPHLCLLTKENRGVIMIKTDAPGVAFAISEANMVNSFWSYLTRLM